MRPLRSTCGLSISLLFSAAQSGAQVATEHPELIGGPWDVASASGIDGIFFEIETSSSGPTGRAQFDWQTMNIRVYRREGGKETWGYFGTKDKAGPQSYGMQDGHSFTLFDGERLRIHFTDNTDIKPFDLDITFSAAFEKWTGTWSRSGQSSNVVLKRPAPNPGVTPSVFVGDWIGESPPHFLPGSLYIRQSRDGALCAWWNHTTSAIDPKSGSIHNNRSNGVWLKVSSATDAGLVLDTTNAMGPPSQFRGTLSEDHQLLTGSWARTGGGRLSAPNRFRRAPSPAVDPYVKSGEQAIPTGPPNNAGSTGDSCIFDFERGEISNCIYQTSRGELVIAPQTLKELDFDSYGLAPVLSPRQGWMYVSGGGTIVVQGVPTMDNGPDSFHDGLVRIVRNMKYGFANRTGQIVIPPTYDGAMNFENGKAKVCKGCESKCVDRECELHVFAGGEWFQIDAKGTVVARIQPPN